MTCFYFCEDFIILYLWDGFHSLSNRVTHPSLSFIFPGCGCWARARELCWKFLCYSSLYFCLSLLSLCLWALRCLRMDPLIITCISMLLTCISSCCFGIFMLRLLSHRMFHSTTILCLYCIHWLGTRCFMPCSRSRIGCHALLLELSQWLLQAQLRVGSWHLPLYLSIWFLDCHKDTLL